MSEVAVPNNKGLEVTALSLFSPTQVNRSAWTGSRRVIGLPGAEVWRARVKIRQLATEAAERPWRAFLWALRGQQNWFRLLLPCSALQVNPTVRAGATAGGYSLPLGGLPASGTALLSGQFLTIPLPTGRYRTVCLTENLTTNSSGQGTATFAPALTEVPVTGVAVEAMKPWLPVSLSTSEAGFSMGEGLTNAEYDVEESR